MPSARIGDLDLAYEDTGAGEPLLLIMGIGANLALWSDAWVAALVARGFRVIRYDHRDCGRSSTLTELGRPRMRRLLARAAVGLPETPPYTIADMANDANGLLQHLGISRAHIVGLSMGGMIAQRLALQHPKRVASLTSVMSTTGSRWYLPQPRAIFALLKKPEGNDSGAYARAIVKMFSVIGSPAQDEHDRAALMQIAQAAAERGVNQDGFVRQLAAVLAEPDRKKQLHALQVPALVIHGLADPLIPAAAGRATAAALGAKFLAIQDMGHDLPKRHWPQMLDAIVTVARATTAPQPRA